MDLMVEHVTTFDADTKPHIEQTARDLLEDLGLIDDDRTEDLRVVAAVGEGALA